MAVYLCGKIIKSGGLPIPISPPLGNVLLSLSLVLLLTMRTYPDKEMYYEETIDDQFDVGDDAARPYSVVLHRTKKVNHFNHFSF